MINIINKIRTFQSVITNYSLRSLNKNWRRDLIQSHINSIPIAINFFMQVSIILDTVLLYYIS